MNRTNLLMTTVFVDQPLALHGSAKYFLSSSSQYSYKTERLRNCLHSSSRRPFQDKPCECDQIPCANTNPLFFINTKHPYHKYLNQTLTNQAHKYKTLVRGNVTKETNTTTDVHTNTDVNI